MSDTTTNSGSNGDAGDEIQAGPATETNRGTPRWVKIFGIIALVLVMLVVVMLMFGKGDHGPSRHGSSGGEPEGHKPMQRR